jgi:hypothetical protein
MLASQKISTSDAWYYVQGDKSVGPLTLIDLKKTLAGFSEAQDILIWRQSYPNWVRAKDVPELAAHVTKPPPLPVSRPRQIKTASGRSRLATGLYVLGFIIFGSQIARDDRSLALAFLIAAGTMGDIRIARRDSVTPIFGRGAKAQ